jgi:hypothetical protein
MSTARYGFCAPSTLTIGTPGGKPSDQHLGRRSMPMIPGTVPQGSGAALPGTEGSQPPGWASVSAQAESVPYPFSTCPADS